MTTFRTVSLAAALPAALFALLVASPAVAEEDHRTDTVGAMHHQWEGRARCRGAKIRAIQDAVITSFDISTKNTKGAKIHFLTYEAFDDAEVYSVVSSVTGRKLGTLDETYGWETGPRINLMVTAQKYYVLLACWDDTTEAGYRGGPKVGPLDISFGEYVGGAYFDGSATPPESFRPATATHDYLIRVHSTDRGERGNYVPFHDTDPFLLAPALGTPGVDTEDGAPLLPETDPGTPPTHDDPLLLGETAGSCTIVAPACGEL